MTTTTTTATTTIPVVTDTTWTVDTRGSAYQVAAPPCCADNYHGDASPAFPPPGEPLADGAYAARASWPDDPTVPHLEVEIRRFVPCAMQPERCEQLPDGVDYAPTDLFVDDTDTRRLALSWDEFDVVLVGFSTPDFSQLRGGGANLAGLIQEVDQAFTTTFAEPRANAVDPEFILADVRDNHAGGFSPSEHIWEDHPGGHAFTSRSGPIVYFQYVRHYLEASPAGLYERGSDALWEYGLEIVDDDKTLYAGSWYVP